MGSQPARGAEACRTAARENADVKISVPAGFPNRPGAQQLDLVLQLRQCGRQRRHSLARPPMTGLEAGHNVRESHLAYMHFFVRRPYFGSARTLSGRQGAPAQIMCGGKSRTTTERAPTTHSSPTVTPGPTKTSAPSHAFSPITMGCTTSGMLQRVKSCVPAQRWQCWLRLAP